MIIKGVASRKNCRVKRKVGDRKWRWKKWCGQVENINSGWFRVPMFVEISSESTQNI